MNDHVGSSSGTPESLSEAVHTPGPWAVGEYDEHLGYDCMTGGIRVGPVCLDGADYGQGWCKEIAPSALAQMTADARLIAAAPELLEALRVMVNKAGKQNWNDKYPDELAQARAAIAKATA